MDARSPDKVYTPKKNALKFEIMTKDISLDIQKKAK